MKSQNFRHGKTRRGTFTFARVITKPARTLSRCERTSIQRTAAVAVLLISTLPALAQTWNEQGPNGIQNGQTTNVTPNNTVSGAVRALLADPANANVIYAGAVNGGVWKSTDAGSTWSPIAEINTQFNSVSISSLSFDQSTSNTIYGGYGAFSSFGGTHGPLAGLIRSTDSGATWSAINGTGSVSMLNRQIYDVYARGSNVVVSTSFRNDGWFFAINSGDYGNVGILRSTDGGSTYQVVSGNSPTDLPNGLPGGHTVGMAGRYTGTNDILLTATEFATSTTTGANANARNGIYRSTDGGATWTLVNNAAIDMIFGNTPGGGTQLGNVSNAKFAFGPNNTAYAALVDTSSPDGRLAGLFRSTDNGATWSASSLDLTNAGAGGGGVNNGGQGDFHLSLVADPTNENTVYVGGDRLAGSPFTARIFRVDASQPSGSQTSLFTNSDTSNNSAPHADTRVMTFDANGQVLLGTDGGIYRRNNVAPGQGQWTALNRLRTLESTGVAYDTVTKALISGQQDNGTSIMSAGVNVNTSFASKTWTSILGGDGGKVAADPLNIGAGTVATNAVRYYSSQFLGGPGGAFRRSFSNTNTQVGGTTTLSLNVGVGGPSIYTYENTKYGNLNGNNSGSIQFLNPIGVNRVEGGRYYVGTRRIYESVNQGATLVDLNGDLAASAGFGGGTSADALQVFFNAIEAGGRSGGVAQPNVLYVGTYSAGTTNRGGQLFVRPASAAAQTPVSVLTDYSLAAGTSVDNSVVFDVTMDTANWENVFTAARKRIWAGTVTIGPLASSWTDFTGNLLPGGSLFSDPYGIMTSVEFVPIAGQPSHGALLAGTSSGLFFDLTDDATHTWRTLAGANFPNAFITQLQYDLADDVLVVATLGRGTWTLPTASQFFTTVPEPATAPLLLVFGAAMSISRRTRISASVSLTR